MKPLHRFALAGFGLSLALVLSACSFSLAADVTPPPGAVISQAEPLEASPAGPLYPLAPPNPADGAPIYAEKCAPCHGQSGQGNGPQARQLPVPAAPLGSPELARRSTPAEWYAVVTQGNLERFMPPFDSLSQGERWDVVAYLYTLSSSPQALDQGEQLYGERCAACHGVGGRGDGPQAASLATSPPDLADQERMAGKSAEELFQAISDGVGPDMPAYAGELSEEERWALADYLRSLTFASSARAAAPAETAAPQETAQPQVAAGSPTAAAPGAEAAETPPPERIGAVKGKVVNASGGQTPASLNVTLHGYDEMRETYTLRATADGEGAFAFEEVEMPEGRVFVASVEYAGAVYASDIAVAEAGTSSLELTVPVFETTTDAAALSVDRLHVFFEYVEPDTLRVVELFVVSNLGNRTVVPARSGEPVLSIDLPEGAANLQFEGGALGERFVETASGFGDTAPVQPGAGNHQIVFAFDMPYEGRLELVQPVNLPINAVVILVPEDGPKVKGEQLQDAGSRDVRGVAYRMYSSGRLEEGAQLAMTVSGRPGAGGVGLAASSETGVLVGAVALGLALMVAGTWLYRRSRVSARQAEEGEAGEAMAAEDLPNDAETLMDAILALDDLYQEGELPEEAYRQRRAELKARLKEMLGR